jgi:co-chaperonin GroES (HSP10)
MNILHDRIICRFDEKHNKIIPLGDTGIELYRPDEWLHRDEEGKQTFIENFNYLETKPQIATVTESNSKYPYQRGDKLFLHYMAHETAKYANEETKEAFVLAEYVLFTFMDDGSYKIVDGVYFGEQVLTEDEKTAGGIIINVLGQKPKLCQIKLTHVPSNAIFEAGQVILSIDNYQYKVNVDGKTYIMLREREIVGTVIEEVA